MRTDFKRLERERRAALAAAGGDRVLASLRHHEDRLRRAVASHDYASQRDAQKVIADLRAQLASRT